MSSTSKRTFTPTYTMSPRAWRQTEEFEKLDEEQQLHLIYSTTKGSHKTTLEVTDDDIVCVSSRMLDTYWCQLRLYVIFKSLIWIAIGLIIYHESMVKYDQLHHSPLYCCDCYHYAASQHLGKWYEHPLSRRVDWSYCPYSSCFNCTACMQRTAAMPVNETECETRETKAPSFADSDRECLLDGLSDTTMGIFYKDYRAYGIGALVICMVYTLCHLFALCLRKSVHYVSTIGMLLMVYNIIVAMACFYMVFKVFQYQKKDLVDPHDKHSYYCYVDTTVEVAEHILSVLVYAVFALLLLQWFVCCCKCVTKNRRSKELSCLVSGMERFYIVTLVCCGSLFFMMMAVSVIMCIVHLVRKSPEEVSRLQLGGLIVTVVVLSICTVDIFCCPFCQNRVRLFWMARRNRERNMSTNSKVVDYHQRQKYFDLMARESLLHAKKQKGTENVTFKAADDDDKY